MRFLPSMRVRPDEKLGVLVADPEAEPSEDVEGLDEEGRAAAADKELTELLAVEYEGLPSIPASMLEDATDRAAELLVDLGVLGWLSPLIVDDLVGAVPAKRGR